MKILISFKEIIVVYILQILLLFISSFIYINIFNGNNLNSFIVNDFYYIMLIFNIVLIIYLIKHYYKKEENISFNYLLSSVFIVISISLILNMLFFKFNLQSISNTSISIYLMIVSSGIVGPIVEEFLFRKVALTKLLKQYPINKSIIIETFIFSLFHTGINGFIYAFIIGLLLSIIYIKYKNIKIPIICHMLSNTLVLYLCSFNIYILSLAIIMLVLGIVIIKK